MGLVATWLHHHGIKPSDCDYVDMLRTQFAILKIQNFLRQHIQRFRASHSGSFGAIKAPQTVSVTRGGGRGGLRRMVETSTAIAIISDQSTTRPSSYPLHTPTTTTTTLSAVQVVAAGFRPLTPKCAT